MSTTELTTTEAPDPAGGAVGLFRPGVAPAAVVEHATAIADVLAGVIRDRQLSKMIGKKPYVFLEGWTLLGSMLGVFAVVEWTRPVYLDGNRPWGWEARAEVRNAAGVVLGAVEAECTRDEYTWTERDDFALRSMAQTRAVVKAYRLPLGFIMQLAGYEPTPAEDRDEPPPPERPTVDGASAANRTAAMGRLRAVATQHGMAAAELDALAESLYGARPDWLPLHQVGELARRIDAGEWDEREAPNAVSET